MRELTQAAQAAKLIRTELKKAFPTIKFSVISENYSMGNSININYIDGPITDAVENIVNKYQLGEFNGMEDIYEYTNSRDDIPQSMFVFVKRETSEKIYNTLKEKVIKFWGIENDHKLWEKTGYGLDSLIHQEFFKMDLYKSNENKSISTERDELETLREWKKSLVTA